MMQSRGWGAMKPLKKRPVEDRYCMSPQLAPPPVDPKTRQIMLNSDNYHEGKRK